MRLNSSAIFYTGEETRKAGDDENSFEPLFSSFNCQVLDLVSMMVIVLVMVFVLVLVLLVETMRIEPVFRSFSCQILAIDDDSTNAHDDKENC